MRDVPLTDLGKRQAAYVGKYGRRNLQKPGIVFMSPARRSVETCKIALDNTDWFLPCHPIEDLQEMSWGAWEGEPHSVFQRNPRLKAHRAAQGTAFQPPGGESFDIVQRRVVGALRYMTKFMPNDGYAWVFTHQDVMKSLMAQQRGFSVESLWSMRVPLVGVMEVHCDRGVVRAPLPPRGLSGRPTRPGR